MPHLIFMGFVILELFTILLSKCHNFTPEPCFKTPDLETCIVARSCRVSPLAFGPYTVLLNFG